MTMKINHIIPLFLLAGCCAVSAQTTNTQLTNAISNKIVLTLLTTNQAKSLVLRLVKEKAPEYYSITKDFDWVEFVNGHWHYHCGIGHPRWDEYVDVTIAPDGSTNCVETGRESWSYDIQ